MCNIKDIHNNYTTLGVKQHHVINCAKAFSHARGLLILETTKLNNRNEKGLDRIGVSTFISAVNVVMRLSTV